MHGLFAAPLTVKIQIWHKPNQPETKTETRRSKKTENNNKKKEAQRLNRSNDQKNKKKKMHDVILGVRIRVCARAVRMHGCISFLLLLNVTKELLGFRALFPLISFEKCIFACLTI